MGGSRGTPKARALGRTLAELRNAAKMSQRQLAERIGRGAGTVARWELGERAPDPTDVAQVLTVLGIHGERYDSILAMARGADDPQWLAVTLPELRQQLSALLAFEREATSIIDVSPLLIPGLLQIAEYSRAIMTSGNVPANEVDTRVALRVGRATTTLQRRNPARLLALIGEPALRTMIGGPHVMAEQLRHLTKMARLPNVDLRVVPIAAGWNPCLEGSFMLLEFAKAATVVHLEVRDSALFLHDPDNETYRDAADQVLQVAMSPEESADYIGQEIKRMEMT